VTALSDAAHAVEEARDRILARLWMAVGGYDRTRDEQLVDALAAAVRHHDAETVRAMDPVEIALAGRYAGNDIANRLDAKGKP
jgi:hypothetical protein